MLENTMEDFRNQNYKFDIGYKCQYGKFHDEELNFIPEADVMDLTNTDEKSLCEFCSNTHGLGNGIYWAPPVQERRHSVRKTEIDQNDDTTIEKSLFTTDNSSDIEDEFARGLGQMPSLDYLTDEDPHHFPLRPELGRSISSSHFTDSTDEDLEDSRSGRGMEFPYFQDLAALLRHTIRRRSLIFTADNSSDIEDEFARGLGQMPSLDYLIDDDPLNSP
uniref:Uncharacterized protein LOC111099546 n=1 Tax=Crassostrea virginica TaxID=6565 RepID=A0A8B8A7E8_CRAVI|nr:uncharacterized protein LOC111099546 [Crassostrea virginica]